MTPQEYDALIRRRAKPSPMGKDLIWAFCTGGLICTLGQLLRSGFMAAGLDEDGAGAAVSAVLIALTALFTGLGLFDRLAKRAGAGTLVPITGFANAVVSPALEFKSEGLITGTCVKMFTIAGPVIVSGLTAGTLYGVLLAIWTCIA